MSKIICDVCGTRYPDTAEQCPICGHIRGAAGKTAEDVLIMDDARLDSHEKVRGGRFSKSNVKKRTGGVAPIEAAPAKSKAEKKADKKDDAIRQNEDVFAEDTQSKKVNTILNVLLIVVIIALMVVIGYIFTQHVLPAMAKPTETVAPPTIAATEAPTVVPTETEEPTIPCEELVLQENEVLLTEYEQKWLINVEVLPGDTTDELVFTSSDEMIAAVDAEGCVTALAEGMVTITISCGNIQTEYSVACIFPGVEVNPGETLPPPTDPPPTEPPEEMTVTTNNVNVRSGPGTGYDKVGKLNKGDTILVYEIQTVSGRKWGRIDMGWICLDYAK